MKNLTRAILLVLALSCQAFATLPVTAVWELNASATGNGAGANTGGGGFNPARTSPNTDLACLLATTAAPTCTSVGDPFIAADDETWLFIQSGGTYTAGIFCRISDVTTGTATLDAAVGACNVLSTSTQSGWATNSSAGVASTGSPTGGFWGIDLSRSVAAAYTTTTATTTTATFVVTGGSLTYRPAYVGNIVQLTAGTNCTQKWYEITASTLNVSFTMDSEAGATCTTSSYSIGGAISLGSGTANRTDDVFFEQGSGTNGTGGMRFWVKGSLTYTFGSTVNIAASCGTQAPCVIRGYQTIRGDSLTASQRPTFIAPTATFTAGAANWNLVSLNIYNAPTSTANVLAISTSAQIRNVKVVNYSTTANLNAITNGTGSLLENVEAVSIRGRAIGFGSTGSIHGCYVHDSDQGIRNSASTTLSVDNCIIASNVSFGFNVATALTAALHINNTTIYGSETPTGTCLNLVTATTNVRMTNSILYGCATGAAVADVQTVSFDANNAFFNNTANPASGATTITNWPTATNDLAISPGFTSSQTTGVAQIVNVGTVSSSTNVLTDTGADFTNVVNDVDYVNITGGSGTGFTNGVYPIHSHTTTTLTLATPSNTAMNITSSGAGSAITYQITLGHNFAVGSNMANGGFPGAFPGGLTTGYLDIGAAQRQATSSSGNNIIGQ